LKNNNFLIEGACLWRGDEEAVSRRPVPILIRGGRIAELDERALRAAGDLPRVDFRGRWLIPGLIDAHVHLELDPRLRPVEQLAVPELELVPAMAARAEAMLAAGITTARDCGGGRHREHRLRTEIEAGRQRGPRLLCCGQPLTPPGGHCDFWGGEVSTRDDLDVAIARQVEAGSDWIKVMATGGLLTPGSRAGAAQFGRERLGEIVAIADRYDRRIAAHCHGTQGIALAVRAGARTIEHASFAGEAGFGTDLDVALMREMAQREVWVSPTVNAGWGRRIEDAQGAPTDFFRRMSGCLRAQRAEGVRFIASTDAGIPGIEHHDFAQGLMAFARFAALEPVEVLRAATSEAARALGLESETGRLEPGLSADLLVLASNPLEDLETLRHPVAVVFRGEGLDESMRQR